MKSFHLQIVTPTGVCYDGQCHEVSVRTVDGGVSILANHIPYVTALGSGRCSVYCEDGRRDADCEGGMLTVSKECVRIVSSGFRWRNPV